MAAAVADATADESDPAAPDARAETDETPAEADPAADEALDEAAAAADEVTPAADEVAAEAELATAADEARETVLETVDSMMVVVADAVEGTEAELTLDEAPLGRSRQGGRSSDQLLHIQSGGVCNADGAVLTRRW